MPKEIPTALVIGGSGFIGRSVVSHLLEAGFQVRSLDIGPNKSAHPQFEHWSGSFLQSEILKEAMLGVDHVYHLAATAMPQDANNNPKKDCLENVVGTIGVLETAIETNVSRLVFSSSGGTVYGPTNAVPIVETHANDPIVAYGVSKLAIEKYLRLYNTRAPNFSTISLRISNPYGPKQNIAKAQGALTTFCKKAVANERIEIWGDGSVVRDFIHIDDVTRALVAAATSDISGMELNIGAGTGVSLNETLDIIETELGRPVERTYLQARSFDVPRNYLNIEKAKTYLDWKPQVDLNTGVRQMLEAISKSSFEPKNQVKYD